MIKVLWFEVTTPSAYRETGIVSGGWQDSLEYIVKGCKEIELYVAFEQEGKSDAEKIDGITYLPMNINYSLAERIANKYSCKISEQRIVELGLEIIKKVRPNIIHVFGTEWPFGLLAEKTEVPLVIHIQGGIIPYANANYPPQYNEFTQLYAAKLNLRKWLHLIRSFFHLKSSLTQEQRIWKAVSHYMGRTVWDKALVNLLHGNATYHHVEEALRPIFLETRKSWTIPNNGKIKLFSIGCSSFWKGVDMMLKTANVLKTAGIDFEWTIAGWLPNELRCVVEKKERMSFAENNITVLGFTPPEKIIDFLCECTMYVHTAYIENSPNSICEAQFLGVPVVSTHVGGIASLVRNGIDGDLIPANDPWQMADAIVRLAHEPQRMQRYSNNTRQFARNRHAAENIRHQLMTCYQEILESNIPKDESKDFGSIPATISSVPRE